MGSLSQLRRRVLQQQAARLAVGKQHARPCADKGEQRLVILYRHRDFLFNEEDLGALGGQPLVELYSARSSSTCEQRIGRGELLVAAAPSPRPCAR